MLWQKELEKEVVEEIRDQKNKKKAEKKAKHVTNTIVEKTIQRLVEKCVRTTSNLTKFATIIWKVGHMFRYNFATSLQAQPLLCRGVNLGFTSKYQKSVKVKAKARM